MDMDEFHDWEVLQPSPGSDSGNQFKFGEFGADSDGVIRNDYFSVDDDDRYLKTVAAADAVGAAGSGASDNPNWIGHALSREGSDEFCPELEVDRSEIRMLEEFEGKGEIDFLLDKEKVQGGFGGINETGNNFEEFKSGWEGNEFGGAKFEEFEDKELVVEKEENLCDGSEVFTEKEHEIVPTGGETMNKIVEVKKAEVEKKSVVWWKAPFELLKYCMFRFKPVWTFSMAAALIGFAILGHRIYRVKKKIRSLELKVTMDDKKVSQFMSRAARLNEAFSVVKRVPVIRPQLPATGVAPWPVMTKLALQEA
ncbi:PREDICTED: uncharacterized protein LOC109160138 isoform X3 [Ipomoea nil]|uniref:uncharacterized protein LOC109160138 isoform X3 n=1 Tax=Ipomoea nil TaxID=35883 RepID=UPI0009018E73|nr:PREDICTED: uncharacterized protein LOC109160138 isoform X3 [Ipomoea nil]